MTRLDKLIEHVQARLPRARFSDVRTLLEAFGWTLDRERGSHVIFTKTGERSIVLAKETGRWVKEIYLDRNCLRLELDDRHG